MNPSSFITNDEGERLYQLVKALPIVDYHCHLSPREIAEDLPFQNLGQIWLEADHYKWRLMRSYGIDEYYVTGKADWHEKFLRYAEAIELAAGNPLQHWTAMELRQFFGIDLPLTPATAEEIWHSANEAIVREGLSPRKLIARSRVEYIATTDDAADSLEYHRMLRNDPNCPAMVAPSFRTDAALLIRRPDYADYIQRLSSVCGYPIRGLSDLKQALCDRLDFFVRLGCKMTDVGIEFFPDRIGDTSQAERALTDALIGKPVDLQDYLAFLGHMFVFLAHAYRERGLVMQWHLGARRNTNTRLFERCGPDAGGDCMGDPIPGNQLIALLDHIALDGGLPQTILYSLNDRFCAQLGVIAGCFPSVRCGTAWWFCDHRRGIESQIRTIAEQSHLGSFLGMLTDSRSFLSYARHDYFRRVLCDVLGSYVEEEGLSPDAAEKLARRVCYDNSKAMVGGVI